MDEKNEKKTTIVFRLKKRNSEKKEKSGRGMR